MQNKRMRMVCSSGQWRVNRMHIKGICRNWFWGIGTLLVAFVLIRSSMPFFTRYLVLRQLERATVSKSFYNEPILLGDLLALLQQEVFQSGSTIIFDTSSLEMETLRIPIRMIFERGSSVRYVLELALEDEGIVMKIKGHSRTILFQESVE